MASPSTDLSGETIVQVIPALEQGGAERTTLEIARAVVAAGGRSLVVSEGGGLVPRLQAEGSCHVRLPVGSKNPAALLPNKKRLAALIADAGARIVHARSRAPAWPALMAARQEGAFFVTTYHGAYGGKTKLKRLYNSVMARGDVVIANSAYTEQAIREAFAGWRVLEGRRIITIPRGADIDDFAAGAVSEDRLRAAMQAFGGEDAFRVLLPGRLTEWKGQRVLIEAARLLHDGGDIPALRVVLAGATQGREAYEGELRRMIGEAGLSDVVHLAGAWDDMPAAYLWSDVAVSASTRPEAFGRVGVEAMACGRPVVASAHGGSLETVEDGATGLLVPPGDAGRLADALLSLAADPARRAAMGDAGAAHVRTRFSTEAMTDATLRVYRDLLSGGHVPRKGS